MTKRTLVRTLITGAAMTAAAALAAAPASSAPATWTVTPGGPYDAASQGNTVLTDIDTGVVLTCTPDTSTTPASSASGTLDSGSGNTNPLGTIDDITFGNPPGHPCSGPLGLEFTVAQVGTWTIHGESFDGDVTTGYIGNIEANLSGQGCSATVAGEVDATYTNSTGILAVHPDSTPRSGHVLTITSVDPVNNCFNLINSGNVVTFDGEYLVDPVQTISQP